MSDKPGDGDNKVQKTLAADDIVTEQHVGRRSALRVIGATFLGAAVGAALIAAPSEASAQVTDSDQGASSDPPGRGRTGVTDSDTGSNGDRPGHGRGRARVARARRTGRTDRDSSDRPGYGVCAARGHTDSDSGGGADGAGRGRGPCH